MPDYTLALYQSAKGTTTPTFHSNVAAQAQNWQRSISAQGGAWDGFFRVVGPLHELQDWFYNRLGWHVEEVAGGRTWAGLIYEMELTYLGASRRRSLDDVYNYVTARYETGGVTTDTAVAQDATSIAQYGRREEILLLNDYPQAAAEQMRDRYLKQQAYPWPRPLTASATAGESYLDVIVMGYWKTINWRYTSIQTGVVGNVSDYINAIIGADCTDYLTAGVLDTNTVQVTNSTPMPQRAWDTLQEQVELGGASGGVAYPWRLWVDNQRRVNYRPVVTTPQYAIRDDGIYPYAGGQRVTPRQVMPAVMRDMRYPSARVEAGSWLADARDTWVEQVEVDADNNLRLTTSLYDPAEIQMTQLAAQYERERIAWEEAERRQYEEDVAADIQAKKDWDEDAKKRERWWRDKYYGGKDKNKEDNPDDPRHDPEDY